MHAFAEDHFPASEGWGVEYVLLTNRPESEGIQRLKSGRSTEFAKTYPALSGYLQTCQWDLKTVDQCWAVVEKLGRAFGMSGDRNSGEIHEGMASKQAHRDMTKRTDSDKVVDSLTMPEKKVFRGMSSAEKPVARHMAHIGKQIL